MQTINLTNFTEDVDGKLTLASGYQLENLLIWKWNFHFFNGVKSDYIGLPLKSGSCCAVIWTKLLMKKIPINAIFKWKATGMDKNALTYF